MAEAEGEGARLRGPRGHARRRARRVRDRAPKLVSLGAVVLEHWTALEADWTRYYEPAVPSLPLAIWGPEPITLRRFEVLVRNLPDEAQTVRELEGSVRPGQWHNTEELLATLIETVYEGHRLLFSINSKKGRRPPPPLKVPRPARRGEQTPRKRQSTTEELLAVFGHPKNQVVVRYTPKEED